MDYREAVKCFSEEEVRIDLSLFWELKSDEQKYEVMSIYLTREEV